MGKDPTKPRGKMSSYAYFVQTCREEHKKKHPDASVNFAEFSKKCSERWKTMSAKEKGKFEDLARQDKVRYEREMMSYVPVKGGKKKKKYKDPNAPKRPPSAFFIFCSEFRPKVKGESPGLTIGDVAKKLGEMWNTTASEDKQPYEKKAAKLKEKYEKDIAAYRAKGKTGGGAPVKAPAKMVDDIYSGHFLVYKAFNPLVHTSLTERKCVSIQGVNKTKQKRLCISVVFMLYSFFLLFV
uniref:HMG box domain-containing protein n=1 Tax=Monopterus albus TaxID=43700 RepID=A0A3Q3JIT2_MONAL